MGIQIKSKIQEYFYILAILKNKFNFYGYTSWVYFSALTKTIFYIDMQVSTYTPLYLSLSFSLSLKRKKERKKKRKKERKKEKRERNRKHHTRTRRYNNYLPWLTPK